MTLGARFEVREIDNGLILVDPNIYITTPTSMVVERLDMPWARSPDEAMQNVRNILDEAAANPHAVVVVNGKEPDSREFKLATMMTEDRYGRCLKPIDRQGRPVDIPKPPAKVFKKMVINKKGP